MNRPKRLFAGLLLVALAGTGWAHYQAQARQAATLARLATLDACLATSNQQRERAAAHLLSGIEVSVAKSRNQASEMWVLRQAQRIQATTLLLTDTLHQLQQHRPAVGASAMLARLPGQVRQYLDSLDVFETGVYSTDSAAVAQTKKCLRALTWKQVPTSAVLAALIRLEAQVQQVTANALEKQAVKVGSGCDLCFERIGAYAVATAETVAPGELYKVQLMLSASASGIRPIMYANGRRVLTDHSTGQGLVSFRVPPARAGQPDTVRAQWHGQVRYRSGLTDTLLGADVPYYIVKHP